MIIAARVASAHDPSIRPFHERCFAGDCSRSFSAGKLSPVRADSCAWPIACWAEITLRDKLKGYIKEVNEEHPVLVQQTGAATEVAYPQVKQVKGNNLSTGAKVAIGFGIGIVILLLILKDRINGS